MKPRIFIGSSKEALDVAYAIQENLEQDATVTVWTQGIFNLSSNALDDLVKSLSSFDFGVFVFQPDDLVQIRNLNFQSVRDNVIFETGLFIGRLGKEKVYFLAPQSTDKLHLPTDLLGINFGKYDDKREDGNLLAALGPFCNQVRKNLKLFLLENLIDIENESEAVKKLAIEKPKYWKFLLATELMKSRMVEINRRYLELENGLVFTQTQYYNFQDSVRWLGNKLTDIDRIAKILKKVFEIELSNSVGSSNTEGNIFEIKQSVERIFSMCKELLAWEYELISVIPSKEVKEITDLMKDWAKGLVNEVNNFIIMAEYETRSEKNANDSGMIKITVISKPLPNQDKILDFLTKI